MSEGPTTKLKSVLRDVAIFLILYAALFLTLHFELGRFKHSRRDHPQSVRTSAYIALVGAIVGTLYLRTKHANRLF
jgi:hypothetical protein